MAQSITYKIKKTYQIGIRRLYSTVYPSKQCVSLVGLTKEEFIEYINKYKLNTMVDTEFGLTWGIDHIVPVEVFDLTNDDDLKLCYNYQNLMPMFITDNRMKGASVHFSLEKLNQLPSTNITDQLKRRCAQELVRYSKYL